MENFRCHKTYIPKKISERISDTVDLFPNKFTMPKISSTAATLHAEQGLIHFLRSTAPPRPLITLGDSHTVLIRELEGILNMATPRLRPPRVVPPESQQNKQPIMAKTPNKIKILEPALPMRAPIVEA